MKITLTATNCVEFFANPSSSPQTPLTVIINCSKQLFQLLSNFLAIPIPKWIEMQRKSAKLLPMKRTYSSH